ncbi:hypothetical protein [Microbacterium invictum]|uniref:Uncharacterized protein n=1 Tax=Microbacterium invictum TaxID=515415 RepID=A0ABZ0V9D5_9MICO|nr:hypothetical protein [Microbacterium invictum]WQB69739.1 hypothetical protein T9R20_13700 [Microbacterium invictum]
MVLERVDRPRTAGRPAFHRPPARVLAVIAGALAVTAAHFALAPWWTGLTIVAAGCLAIAFALVLRLPQQHPILLGSLVAVFAVVLHATVIVNEGYARFPTAWLHSGYTAHVMAHHDVLPSLGARFSWPAFFVVTAAALSPMGVGVPEEVLRWAPVFFVLACLPPVLVIARRCLGGVDLSPHPRRRRRVPRPGAWRTPWLAVWLFPAVNWLGQDYFAPQSLAFLLGLSILALVLVLADRPPSYWRPRDGVVGRGSLLWPRRPRLPEREIATGRAGQALMLVGVFVVLCAAVAMGHQLTPFVVALQLGVLWYAGRLPWMLPVWIVGVTALIWVSWGASDFWIPFLNDVFGGVGNPVGNVAAGISARTGGSPDHQLVVAVRMGLAAAIVVAAAAGIVVEFVRERRVELSLPLLAAAPGILVFAQSYGGEGVLRVFLYASPFLAMLIAKLLPVGRRMPRRAVSLIVIATLAMVPPFLVARYGNAPFERVTPDEVALASCMYDTAPEGSTLLSVSPHLAWQFRDLADHRHLSANETAFDAETVADLERRVEDTPEPRFLIVTEPQLQFVVRSLGAPASWPSDLRAELASDPDLTPVCENPAGVVYRMAGDR